MAAAPLPIWRRLWAGLPLAYKLVLLGLGTVMTVTLAVMIVTFLSAGQGLKLQMERQLSRDLNVVEAWYRTRLEEIQLRALGLAREPELSETALAAERRRLALNLAVLLRPGTGPAGLRGLAAEAIARGEQLVSTEALASTDLAALPVAERQPGLFRLVATPVRRRGIAVGALVLGERVGAASAIPRQITTLIGGAIALLDRDAVVASAGFPDHAGPRLAPEVWADVRAGRYFFAEQQLEGRAYLLAFRPLLDHRGQPVGAIARGFPEEEISETLLRYAGGIAILATAVVVCALAAFFHLTRRLLFPLRRLALLSAGLAAGDDVPSRGQDEIASLARGVTRMADRLSQSREELAAAAVKLEAEAHVLAERNARLAQLDAERALLLEKIITAQEDERKRLARELHDQTGQSLTSLLVGLKYVEGAKSLDDMRLRTADLKKLTVQTLEEVHQLSLALRPAMLDDLGLVVALRSLVQDFGAQHGLQATLHADPLSRRLPPQFEVTLYRVVQEALTNVAKYAQASRVDVALRADGTRLRLTVVDDGVGFEPTAVGGGGRERLGLMGMGERAALIGGRFELDAAPGRGTRLAIEVEVPKEVHHG